MNQPDTLPPKKESEKESKRETSFIGQMNALIVDDDAVVLRSVEKDLVQLHGEFQEILRESDPTHALELLRIRQSGDTRHQIHFILSDLNIGSTDRGIAFLHGVEDLDPRPYTVIYSGYTQSMSELGDLGHKVVPKASGNLADIIRESMPEIRAYLGKYVEEDVERNTAGETSADPESAEQVYRHAKNSPLPLIKLPSFDPEKDNHDLLMAAKRPSYWLAILDLDNTLYEAESKHSIMLHHFAEFMLHESGHPFGKEHGGNRDALEQLVQECRDWEQERRNRSRNVRVPNARTYQEGILQTGNLSAAAFEGMFMRDLRNTYGKRFIKEHLLEKGKLFDYVPSSIKKLLDHGIMPVLGTGAPDFLVPHILPKIGINYGQGMTYKTTFRSPEEDERLTGEVDVNMGLEVEKAGFVEKLTKRGYATAIAVGDSPSDKGPFQCAVFKGVSKWDINGAAVLVNGSDDAVRAVENEYSRQIGKDGRVRIVDRRAPADDVVAAIGLALRKVFEPLHRFLEIKGDLDNPERLEKYELELDEMRKEGKKVENIENLKRIRDVLEKQGLPKDDVIAELREFYPEIVVEDAVKTDVVNMRIVEDLEAYLQRIGVSRIAMEEVLAKNKAYQEERGTVPPAPKRRSTLPPPPESNDNPTSSERVSIDSEIPPSANVEGLQPTSPFDDSQGTVQDPILSRKSEGEDPSE